MRGGMRHARVALHLQDAVQVVTVGPLAHLHTCTLVERLPRSGIVGMIFEALLLVGAAFKVGPAKLFSITLLRLSRVATERCQIGAPVRRPS